MNGPPEESAVINYSVEVPDQVQAKKQNEECDKRDATVLVKLKVSSLEDIILDKSKTHILSIARVTMCCCQPRSDCIIVEKWG